MRFRVKDYCRIILYLPSEDKMKAPYAPQKPKRIEDDVDMRISEDETPIEPEDSNQTTTSQHRPPSYNPEDYAHAIAKYAKGPNLYIHDHKDKKSRAKEKEKMSKESSSEMSLKQFASLPELLRRLREDLKTAYISFVKELVRDPHDGVTLLLDLLRMIQLAQSNLSGSATNREQQIALRRTLIDEFECLSCLRCCLRCSDAAPRVANYRNGLYSLAAATMSSLTRSRTLALQLLTKACENSVCGHRQVIEAFSTLRLRFAEPVRCKFLVSMMLSYPHPSFQVWGLKLVNAMLTSAVSLKERIYLQEELGEAGFDSASIKKALEHRGASTPEQQEAVKNELAKWNEGYIDLTALETKLTELKSSNINLKQELQHLRQANMKLLEENVLVKAVGGDVEKRCSALKRRLEKHGIPSAPSPTPSVTDSEVSSFVNTGRSTVRRNNCDSPNRTYERPNRVESPNRIFEMSPSSTMDTSCSAGGEKSMSLEWKLMRPAPEGRDTRHLNRASSSRGPSINGVAPPVPKKRQLLIDPDLALRSSVYRNEFQDMESGSKDKDHCSKSKECSRNQRSDDMSTTVPSTSHKTSPDVIINEVYDRTSSNGVNKITQEEHIYKSPLEPQLATRNKISKSSNCTEKENKNPSPNKSLSSSTSSLSGTSCEADLKNCEEHQYENLPNSQNNIQNTSSNCSENNTNSNGSRTCCSSSSNDNSFLDNKTRPRTAFDEGEIAYERDVVVYEAITLGNDTILYDKSNTSGSNSSDQSKKSDNSDNRKTFNESCNSDDSPNVRKSVKHYENLVTKTEKNSDKEEKKGETSKSILNGLINGLKSSKKKDSKENTLKNKKKTRKQDRASKDSKREEVSELEVEAVMSGLESVIRSAESSIDSFASHGTIKENPLLKENFEDRASPDSPINEIEIVPTRVPQIPPRSRSRGTPSSHSSRSRTPDPIVYLESPSETSDTDTFHSPGKDPSSPVTMDTASTKSFGWVRGDPPPGQNVSHGIRGDAKAGIRRRDTFVQRVPDKNCFRQRGLRRSESVHMNHLSEYNSHRSFSPRRRRESADVVPLEENEIQISGRRYTQYTASEIEHRNKVNKYISAEMKRKRNRSFDDRLDQWLDGNYFRQRGPDEDFVHHSNRSSRSFDRDDHVDMPRDRDRNQSKPSRNMKSSRYSSNDLTAFNGFKNPTTGLRESDYGPNFMLNTPPNPHRLEEVLSDLADFGSPNIPNHGGKARNGGRMNRKKIIHEDPAIPTPDYSATPAGTLTNNGGSPPGRHILDMASGLY